MQKKYIILFLAVFILGWLSSSLYNDVSVNAKVISPASQEQLLSSSKSIDRDSPYDHIRPGQILVYENSVVLKLKNAEWAEFTDTKSMDPVLDSSANAIEIVPESEQDIHVGDIIAYTPNFSSSVVTHRVIRTGTDSNGWYAVLKGDNNPESDPGKVRFSQVKSIVVGILY